VLKLAELVDYLVVCEVVRQAVRGGVRCPCVIRIGRACHSGRACRAEPVPLFLPVRRGTARVFCQSPEGLAAVRGRCLAFADLSLSILPGTVIRDDDVVFLQELTALGICDKDVV